MSAENDTVTVPVEGGRTTNETVAVVEQGPTWLVEIAHAPPEWLFWATHLGILLTVVGLGAGVWSVYRSAGGTIDEELLAEWAEIVLIVGCIAGATVLFVGAAGLPYAVDVVGGTTIGFGAAKLVLRGCEQLTSASVGTVAGNCD